MGDADLSAWIGRTEEREDVATPALVRRLAATLDHEGTHWAADMLPPLAHWLCFLPDAPQSALDVDGHPKRGGFLPPIPLPRRMWAGSRVRSLAPVPLGVPLRRVSTIAAVTEKTGRSGTMVFVTVDHVIEVAGRTVIHEAQDLVYREASRADAAPSPGVLPDIAPKWQITLVPDETLLFRYSALTFNAHRIHYDHAYATREEGHAGLVVHGPLAATLLLDWALRLQPGPIDGFQFRAERPLIAGRPLTLAGAGTKLWVCDADGHIAVRATIDREDFA